MSRNCIYCSTDGESCGRVTVTATPRCYGLCAMMDNAHPLILDIAALGVIIGRCRPDEQWLMPNTVNAYIRDSRNGGRYSDIPFPEPDGHLGRKPYWDPARIHEIQAWARSRPGQGVGGGRPRRTIRQ